MEEGNDPETFLFGIEEKASPTKSKAAEEVASGGNKADAEVHNMEVTDDADKPAADTEKTDSVVEVDYRSFPCVVHTLTVISVVSTESSR